jgi:hypothetical protein
MSVQEEIKKYISEQPEPKRSEIQELHKMVSSIAPKCKLWFLTGKDEKGKTVSNPNIGYGQYTINYANGTTRDFFRIGLCATTTGISVYIMGLADKTYLPTTYGKEIGKAKVTGYCISFKTVKDINLDVLEGAVRYGLEEGNIGEDE